jgi:hypothetical protein
MAKERVRRFGALVVGIGGIVLASACTTTTKALAPEGGRASYKIECIKLGDCWAEAQRACRGPYHALEKHENTIPESDLPGLNARTEANTERHYPYGYGLPGGTPPHGPGIESDEPMPIAEVVVVCAGS